MILVAENSLVPIVPGRFSVNLGKLLGKIANGVKADDGRDLLDLQIGVLQQIGGLHAPFLIQKGDEGHPHFPAELMG